MFDNLKTSPITHTEYQRKKLKVLRDFGHVQYTCNFKIACLLIRANISLEKLETQVEGIIWHSDWAEPLMRLAGRCNNINAMFFVNRMSPRTLLPEAPQFSA